MNELFLVWTHLDLMYVKYPICGISDSESPQCVVSKGLAAFQGHLVGAVFLLVHIWPVLFTFGLWKDQMTSVWTNNKHSAFRSAIRFYYIWKFSTNILASFSLFLTSICAALTSWVATKKLFVLVTPYPSFLLQIGDHDDNFNILLPDHRPEVFSASSQRPLSCDICSCPLITLHRKQRC